jgi:hypothetical protein
LADEITLLYRDKARMTTPVFQVKIKGLRFLVAPRILTKNYVKEKSVNFE